MSAALDLTGLTFGRLTVLHRADNHVSPNGRRRSAWVCRCACGQHTTVIGHSLTSKTHNVRSCGCGRINSGNRTPRVKRDVNVEIQPRHRANAVKASVKANARMRRQAANPKPAVLPPHLRPAPTWRGIKAAAADLAAALGYWR